MQAKELMMRPWEDGFDLPETFNMVSWLLERHLGGDDGDRIAIVHQGGEMTYRQLGSMTNRIGNGLITLGIKPGERVIILLHDRPEFMALYLGAMKIGAVPVPINMLATTGDLEYFLRDSEASAVVMEREMFDKLRTILPEIPHLKALVMLGDPAEGTVDLSQLIESSADQLDTYPTSKNDPSYWLYTSGTTGRPKGVIHWHKDLVYSVDTWGRHVVDFKREDRVLCGSKLFFSYGLNNSLYLPLYFGASMILNQDRPTPQRILELIEQHRPTGLFSVPTAYGQMLNYLEGSADQPDLSCLRFCISAGEALPGSLFRRWRDRFGIEILDGLGSTEASFIYMSNRPGKVKENSSGLVLPGHTVEVRDEKSSALPTGELGVLWVKSNSLFHSYWKQPEKTAATLGEGWMSTGDTGYIDAEGYFFFSARANDTMKVSGIWVSPLEVEDAMLSHPAVAECAVVGAEDAMGLIKPKAFVVLMSGYQPGDELVKTLQQYVKQKLAPHKYPRTIEFLEELPKTSTGKIQRFKLRETVNTSETSAA